MNMRTICLMAALALFVTGVSAQGGVNGLTISNNLIFPHFAVGAGYTSEVVLMNPGQISAVDGTLYLFNQDGTPMTVNINGTPASQQLVSLPEGSIKYIELTATGTSLMAGWALFEVTGPAGPPDPHPQVSGSIEFTHASGGLTDGKVGIVGGKYQTGQQHVISIPVVTGNGVNTGVAVVNSGAVEATIVFRLRDINGTVIRPDATITPALPSFTPGAQTARFVTDLFPDVDFTNFQGYLELISPQEGMMAAGLLTDGFILTAIPVDVTPTQTYTVVSSGFTFSPATITVHAGDTIQFNLSSIHNAVEVSQATWNANGTTSNGGFSLPFGGGALVLVDTGTYYYVCQVHASMGMKGMIIVN